MEKKHGDLKHVNEVGPSHSKFYYVQEPRSPPRHYPPQMHCDYCGGVGHTIEYCSSIPQDDQQECFSLQGQGSHPRDGPPPHQQAHLVTLRSGKDLEEPYKDYEPKRKRDVMRDGEESPPLSPKSRIDNTKKGKVSDYIEDDENFVLEEIGVERDQEKVFERDQGKRKESNEVVNTKQASTSKKANNSPIPFPNRSRVMNEEKKFSKFLDMLKKLKVSLPFTEVETQMPLYTKFMKDVLTNKRSIVGDGLVALRGQSDRSVQRPMGVIEDVPVKVGNFYIPADFVVLDIPEDQQTLIILGRPFLATGDVNISVKEGKLTFKVGGNVVEFSLTGAMSQPMFESV
ncbi:uncharacterized protein LOC141629582 [Silene latifolia]|uniref:uncharacterized protein LOC141629582 n=1 Tax=Silene latifolia TaxID=37657 RepID=UPI003D772F10